MCWSSGSKQARLRTSGRQVGRGVDSESNMCNARSLVRARTSVREKLTSRCCASRFWSVN
ncbi:hypothetical protein MA16_Dca013742 [Dendrobium catenatum]|uniref:Uncharacterized protein n=1 Tax=Dendrobium catenatum TaxID=906689 RepID=A0A2I0VWC2_9ASPA|nr:hypothetical protein MA16_Dca013742 [Dendrobium catenatum]